jgi:predicted GIY-YIG superfamily endonuclease
MQTSEIKNNTEQKTKEFTNNDKKLEFKFVIYVLKLAEGRIYVGRTTKYDLDKRIKLHKSRRGSAWTRKYKFVEEMKDYYI